jgi:hypothetical protein
MSDYTDYRLGGHVFAVPWGDEPPRSTVVCPTCGATAFIEGRAPIPLRVAARAVIDALDAGRIVQVPDEASCPELDALRAAIAADSESREETPR